MSRLLYSALIGVVGCLILAPAMAKLSLLEAYHLAIAHDPFYQEAEATYKAAREAVPQRWADLLPNLAATGFLRENRTAVQYENSPEQSMRYNSKGFSLQLSQSIFNYPHWKRLGSAQAKVKQAEAQFASSVQKLIIRVAKAYFGVLAAEDELRFTRAEKQAIERQLEQAKQRYEVGLDAITAVYEAQASYDAIVAKEIAAENQVQNRQEELRLIIGQHSGSALELARLKKDLPLIPPQPNNIDSWVELAIQQNLELFAARYAQIAAREDVKASVGGHLPELNLVASYSDSHNSKGSGESLNNLARDTRASAIGLEVRWPLFAGGKVISQSREAQYRQQEAMAREEAAYRQSINNTRKAFNNVIAGINKIKADRQAIISGETSLKSTEAAFKVGTRTLVDVLLTQSELFKAQKNHAQDQYEYINNLLALKEAVGMLTAEDVEQIDQWLEK